MTRPPADEQPIDFKRAALLLVSVGVLLATLFGYIAQQSTPRHIPVDGGTPTTVTTIGEPR